ncbi:hypothetical protein [Crocosphaera sp.]|uniref:hypothetical protein n=1 Tax=Crocosphaera sp. TaxID=2729996 RepID=UPI003F27F7E7|nr:hypothetical protein [Crocosphaera sp.]
MNRKKFLSLLGLSVLVASVIIGCPRQPDSSGPPISLTKVTVNQAFEHPKIYIRIQRES